MTDQNRNPIEHELRQQEAIESGLSAFFASIAPPADAKTRLLEILDIALTESMLTLDDAGPYSFEEAAALSQIDDVTTDLLAAGLEEQLIDDDSDDDDEQA